MMQNGIYDYPYPSRRLALYGGRGAVGASQHLAAQAGLDTLKKGGNAIDAAVTAAACLVVLEPPSNGMGGDSFAIVSTRDGLFGLNASGPSAMRSDAGYLRQKGFAEMPGQGVYSVTVPGTPAAWAALTKRFGRRSLAQNLEAAIDYAENGFIFSAVHYRTVVSGYGKYHALAQSGQEEYYTWEQAMCPGGVLPDPGQKYCLPLHAQSLRQIAQSDAQAFYRGEIAQQMDAFFRKYDGFLRKEDFAAYEPRWVEPVSVNYRGYDVWEIPPNGQGVIALLALNILKGFSFEEKNSVDTWHKTIEAVKVAFSDGLHYITDPNYMSISVSQLLSETYAAQRRAEIGETARLPYPGTPHKGGTVYLNAADDEGNMISYIQSISGANGSGLFIPGTGVSLQNRGGAFKLDKQYANYLEPNKYTYHTIIPGFLTKNGTPVGPFGIMGGYMQPQAHTQVMMNTLDFAMNPQQALDAPRFRWESGLKVKVEQTAGDEILQGLSERGHDLKVTPMDNDYGHGQIIWKTQDGFVAGTEPRIDGAMAMH